MIGSSPHMLFLEQQWPACDTQGPFRCTTANAARKDKAAALTCTPNITLIYPLQKRALVQEWTVTDFMPWLHVTARHAY